MTENSPLISAKIAEAVSETFGNMAFLDVAPVQDATLPEDVQQVIWAKLLIHDPIQSEMMLYIPESALSTIAKSIYAIPEDELSSQIKIDCIAELLNTIAGRFLTDILPADRSFQLGLPETGETPGSEIELLANSWHFLVDNCNPIVLNATAMDQLEQINTNIVI